MKYLVIELQTNAEGHVGNIITAHDTKLEAEAKYHTVLAAAAASSVLRHGAVMLTNTGTFIASECFSHSAPEPEPAVEAEGGAE